MYKTIYIPVDNSDHSNTAVDVGVELAKTYGSKIVGSHVYAAKMHDKRFKQMEAGLPEEYHDEKELDRQRQIHDSLITRGLQIITDSYLDYVDKKCNEANLPVERRSLEGRNWKVLAEDINTNAYDLVIMGALGVGAVKDSVIGSNTERVLRRVRNSDMLIIKQPTPVGTGKIVVAVDGSPYSFGGLMTGLALGKAFNVPVEAISAFDPYFHYAAFHSISGVLNEEAGKVFRFKEQEKLHEEVIDSGLAKIYQSHLDISREIAQAEQTDVKTTLLDGKASRRSFNTCGKKIRGFSSWDVSASTATRTWISAATRKTCFGPRRAIFWSPIGSMCHRSIRRRNTPLPGPKKPCAGWNGFPCLPAEWLRPPFTGTLLRRATRLSAIRSSTLPSDIFSPRERWMRCGRWAGIWMPPESIATRCRLTIQSHRT